MSSTFATDNAAAYVVGKDKMTMNKLKTLGSTISDDQSAVEAHLEPEENEKIEAEYVMGYFDWYWKKHGFKALVYKFFKKSVLYKSVYQICYNIGYAFGLFAMSKWWFPSLCTTLRMEHLLEYNYIN